MPQPDQSSELDIQRTPVSKQSRCTARMDEDNVFVGLPAAGPHECDQASKSFPRIDRIGHESFKRTRQFDCLDCCSMRNPVSWPCVAGDHLYVSIIE